MQVSVAKNTATNYLVTLIRTIQGLLVTRCLIGYLGDAGYGFWMLLWTFFGYALLVDFGAGIAGQKYTSQELFKRDIRHYNSIISLIFTFHVLMALLIVVGVIVVSFHLENLFQVHDLSQLAYYRKCFFVFAFGAAVLFPSGVLNEILIGLHKIYINNFILAGGRIVEIIAFYTILKCGGGLFQIVCFEVLLMAAERLIPLIFIKRLIPGFQMRLHLYDRKVFREVFGFSSGSYFMSLARLLRVQTRNPIISKYCGLDFVGVFNLSNRLSELCNQAITQYNNNVRPVTAQLFHRGRTGMLRTFVMKSMQWNVFMCCLIIIPAAVVRDEAIFALFKKDVTPLIHSLSLLSLLGVTSAMAFTQIPSSVLLMCERHHLLARVNMAEAVFVITMNILFLRAGYSIICIEIISISTSLFIFLTVRFPVMLRIIQDKFLNVFCGVYLPPLLTAVPAVAVLYCVKRLLAGHVNDFLLCAVCGTSYAAVYLATAWQFLVGRTKKELWKRRVMLQVRKRFPKKS